MKTTLTILAAIIMPGGLIILGVALVTYVMARSKMREKAMQPALPA